MGLRGHSRDKRKVERLLLYFVAISTLAAQPEFRTEGRLVLVNAGVYDDRNQFRDGLTKEDFQLWDEGEEMRLQSVAVEEVAVSAVILLDVSKSMKNNIGHAREALSRFLDRARPGDEFCLITFSESAPMECEFSDDTAGIRTRAEEAQIGGGTALGDALLRAFGMVKRARNARRAVLILSDGLENSSAHRWNDVRRAAMETEAIIYAVTLPVWRDRDAWRAVRLEELAVESGGRMFTADPKELAAAMERLEVRLQYVLAFEPPANSEVKPWRSVRVKLRGPGARNLRVYWRHKYHYYARVR